MHEIDLTNNIEVVVSAGALIVPMKNDAMSRLLKLVASLPI